MTLAAGATQVKSMVTASAPLASTVALSATVSRRTRSIRSVSNGRVRGRDRKSTRLNSSHSSISYAVFCLKKKKKTIKVREHERKYTQIKNNGVLTFLGVMCNRVIKTKRSVSDQGS